MRGSRYGEGGSLEEGYLQRERSKGREEDLSKEAERSKHKRRRRSRTEHGSWRESLGFKKNVINSAKCWTESNHIRMGREAF